MLSRTCKTARTVVARTAIGLMAAVFALQAGCETPSDTVSTLERAASFKAANDAYTALGYRHVWTGFPTMTVGATVDTVDVLGDVVAVQESSGVLSILETNSGLVRWSDQLGNAITKFLGVLRDDRRIVCVSETEAFYLDVDAGTLVGKQTLEKVGNTKPEIVGDLLVYGTSGGEIFGLVKIAGFRAWGASMPGTIEVNPARMGNTLGFVSQSGDVLFLDGATGSGFVRGKMFMGTRVPPAASNDLMFIASRDQSIYAFSPASPSPVWRHRTNISLRDKPVYHAGTVYCAVDRDGLTALTEFGNGGRGEVKWVCKGVFGHVIGVRGGRLLVWDGHDACLVDPATGDLIERVTIENVANIAPDAFVDGNLYLTSPQGVVAKLSPRK